MQQFLKVLGHEGLVRDTATGAILNTNRTEYEEYVAVQRKAADREAEISQHTEDINNIKSDLQEIKSLLLTILKKD
jgi:predicted transcriptional regulator